LKGKREDVVLATKCVLPMGEKPFHRGMSRKHVLSAVDASLKRLQTDYVDLYQLHMYDPETPLDEALEALDMVVKSGKARYIGVSNWPAWKVARALGRGEVKNLARIDSVQPRYNMLFRNFELDLLPMCQAEGIGVIPYNPLAGGFLTGKHKRTGPPTEGTRFTLGSAAGLYQGRYWHDRQFDVVEEIVRLAGEAGMTPASLAVAWVMANPAITSPIVGASKPEQLADSVKAAEAGPLPADLKARLDELTHAWRRVDEER
jgi:aryl-alcohol dehydrogenase (NADP+)